MRHGTERRVPSRARRTGTPITSSGSERQLPRRPAPNAAPVFRPALVSPRMIGVDWRGSRSRAPFLGAPRLAIAATTAVALAFVLGLAALAAGDERRAAMAPPLAAGEVPSPDRGSIRGHGYRGRPRSRGPGRRPARVGDDRQWARAAGRPDDLDRRPVGRDARGDFAGGADADRGDRGPGVIRSLAPWDAGAGYPIAADGRIGSQQWDHTGLARRARFGRRTPPTPDRRARDPRARRGGARADAIDRERVAGGAGDRSRPRSRSPTRSRSCSSR